MGLFDIFKRMVSPGGTTELRILILGLDNAGKTSILKQLSQDPEGISTVVPTQGFNVKTITQDKISLVMWDIGGQATIRPYWQGYYSPDTSAIIFVIDSTDKDRMKEVEGELNTLLEEEKLTGVPMLIFANKQDLEGALSAKEISEELALVNVRDRAWQINACSAKTGEGLKEGMLWVSDNGRR